MIKNVTLSGEVELIAVKISGIYVCVKNRTEGIVYASASPITDIGGDEVLPIDPNESATLSGVSGTVYLRGNGAVTLVGTDSNVPVFSGSGDDVSAPSGSGLIRCELHRRSDDSAVILNVSGAVYFGVRGLGSAGPDIALLAGSEYADESVVDTKIGETYINEVPASGNIYIKGTNAYVLYTADTYEAIERAAAINLAGLVEIYD